MNNVLLINMMTRKALEILSMPEAEFNRRNETEMAAEIERLRARIAELEGSLAVTFGTLEKPTPDEPSRFTCNIPPSAPPHDE